MSHASVVEHVRRLVAETFERLDAPSPTQFSETILLQKGHYNGRRFTCDSLEAVWLAREEKIEFRDADAKLLHTSAITEPAEGDRRKAA